MDTGLDMEVDEDGAPKMASEARLFATSANNKKRAPGSADQNADDDENSVDAKKAKLEEDQQTTDNAS